MSDLQERIAERIQAILADPNPEMRRVENHRILVKRVRIFLDRSTVGYPQAVEDVTRLCQAFSIPTGRVELVVEDENGRKLLDFTCGCTTIRGRRPPYTHCPECHQDVISKIATETRHGVVKVEAL